MKKKCHWSRDELKDLREPNRKASLYNGMLIQPFLTGGLGPERGMSQSAWANSLRLGGDINPSDEVSKKKRRFFEGGLCCRQEMRTRRGGKTETEEEHDGAIAIGRKQKGPCSVRQSNKDEEDPEKTSGGEAGPKWIKKRLKSMGRERSQSRCEHEQKTMADDF